MADETVPPEERASAKAEFAVTGKVPEPHLVHLISGLRREQVQKGVRLLLYYVYAGREIAAHAAGASRLRADASALRRLHLGAIGSAFPTLAQIANGGR
jgi:hypothetical protein